MSAMDLYEKSEIVFAERWLSCRTSNALPSFQARKSSQCLCVCVWLCLRLRGDAGKLWNYTRKQNLSSP